MKEDYNNFKSNAYNVLIETVAGWSSLEARRAHNPKVTGSNPVPAIRIASSVQQRALYLLLQTILTDEGRIRRN